MLVHQLHKTPVRFCAIALALRGRSRKTRVLCNWGALRAAVPARLPRHWACLASCWGLMLVLRGCFIVLPRPWCPRLRGRRCLPLYRCRAAPWPLLLWAFLSSVLLRPRHCPAAGGFHLWPLAAPCRTGAGAPGLLLQSLRWPCWSVVRCSPCSRSPLGARAVRPLPARAPAPHPRGLKLTASTGTAPPLGALHPPTLTRYSPRPLRRGRRWSGRQRGGEGLEPLTISNFGGRILHMV